MRIAPHNHHAGLKRPRSTSQPPSPSSSSPKRAASESDDHVSVPGTGIDMTNPGMVGSPLRDRETDASSGSGEWVQRTEDVHLNEVEPTETVPEAQARFKELYDAVIGAIPPPFETYETYYILPKSFDRDLKALALGDGGDDKAAPKPTDLQLDLTHLVEDVEAQEVHVIQPDRDTDGKARPVLSSSSTLDRVWTLKDGLVEDEDFFFVHAAGWNSIMELLPNYSGPRLPRYCLSNGSIQLKPPVFHLYVVEPSSRDQPAIEAQSSAKPIKFTCPTKTPLSTFLNLAKDLAAEIMTSYKPLRLTRYWQLDLANPPSESSTLPALDALVMPHTLLPSLAGSILPPNRNARNLDIEESGLASGDGIVVEIGKFGPMEMEVWTVDVNSDGKAVEKGKIQLEVPKAPQPLFSKPPLYGANDATGTTSSTASSSRMATRSQSRQPERGGRGLVGLVNLGNTCFMNSAVQCLSNTRELSEYFLSGVYRDELNPDNPLGMHGQIARTFGQTIENLWTQSNNSSFSPRMLKQQTSRFAPQFAGYGQHDTQEFIAFLLDGLHEDLNRIIKKPYIEKPDWKAGGSDKQLAELGKECWEGYKKRNDSVIVDLFQGQLQSTLVCPECQKESITLDPFMYLTVPLPIAQHRQVKVEYIPRDPEQAPVIVRLLIPQNASFQHLKERLASVVKVNPNHLVGFDMWKGHVYNWWYDSDHNSEMKDHDIAVWYDTGVPSTLSKRGVGTTATDGSVTIPVYTYKVVDAKHLPSDCSLHPFFITLSKAEAADPTAVRAAIMRGYQRFMRESVKSQLFVSSSSSHAIVPPPVEEESEADIDTDGEKHGHGSPEQSMDLDHQSPAQPQPHLSPNLLQRAHGSSTSLSSLTSTRSHKQKLVPRGDLFKVHVADASASDRSSGFGMNMFKSKDTNVQPFFRATISEASRVFSPLENRLKIKKGMFGRITSGINNMMSSSSSSAGGGAGAESETEHDAGAGSAPSTPNSPPPVVRAGEGIFVEWNVKRFNEYFDNNLIPETVYDPAIEVEQRKKKEGRVIGIEDCLDEFSKEETLGQDDLWYCPVCKKHQAATKKLEIYKAPDILVICIKRFGSSRRLSDKLDNMVNFPIEGLDLEDRVAERRIANTLDLSEDECKEYGIEPTGESLVYDLYAVDNHFGGLGGGHYTAFCKNKTDDQWYNYDDSRVSPATEKAVQSRAAYLLFYRRRAQRPIGGISRVKAEQASRAVTPAPPSPSSPSSSASSSPGDRARTTFREALPDYTQDSSPASSNSAPPTPPLSSSSDDDNASPDAPDYMSASSDLGALGSSVGFGNTRWGSNTDTYARPEGINHSFATPESESDIAKETHTTTTTTTTTDNDDTSASAGNGLGEETSGLGDTYQVVAQAQEQDRAQ